MLSAWIEWPILAIVLIGCWWGETSKLPLALDYLEIPDQSLKACGIKCAYWIAVAIAFNVLVLVLTQSNEIAEAWTSGYILEYTLSIDNLFIFQIMFRIYQTPECQIDKALLFGIGAAAILRLVFFIVGTSLFEFVTWVRIPFGILLLVTAYKTATAPMHAASSSPMGSGNRVRLLELAERYLPFSAMYDMNGKFFQYRDSPDWLVSTDRFATPPLSPAEPEFSHWTQRVFDIRMTMLTAVVIALAVVDVIFALDAVAAKVAQTHDLFVNFTSSLFAMAGFRSLYFVIEQLTIMFRFLKFGVALVLAYVGFELIISIWYHIPNYINCIVIMGICGSAIVASVMMSVLERFKPMNSTIDTAPHVFGLEEDDEIKSPLNPSP